MTVSWVCTYVAIIQYIAIIRMWLCTVSMEVLPIISVMWALK